MESLKYLKADPAGNITGFIIGNLSKETREELGLKIFKADPTVEQIGFISLDENGKPSRMDMFGGFCGNATRTFGLFKALETERESGFIDVEVSGADGPLNIEFDTEEMTAKSEMPKVLGIKDLEVNGVEGKVVDLGGIVHFVVEIEEDREFVDIALKEIYDTYPTDTYGVLFLDREEMCQVPYVYVGDADTLFREGSCGSGSIAIGNYLANEGIDFDEFDLGQPGGDIQVSRVKKDGEYIYSIGGKIELDEIIPLSEIIEY